MKILIGVDIGTSSCKVVAINLQGNIVAEGIRSYETRFLKPGWAEQDPQDWYRSACEAIRACVETNRFSPKDVLGISIDGPAHSVALMDERGCILYPTINWCDLRSQVQTDFLIRNYNKRLFELTYQCANPSWTLSHLLWLRENEPFVWKKLSKILVTKDYVAYRFTGAYHTDRYDAIGTQLYDITTDSWSEELCGILGLNVSGLPKVLFPNEITGNLLREAAMDMGLITGIPVAVGSGDSVVEAFGSGIRKVGQGIIKLGTAVNVNLITSEPRPSLKTITYPYLLENQWFSIAATNSGTATLKWFHDVFCKWEIAFAQKHGLDDYDLITENAAEAPMGCEGLLFHPYLMGERSPYWDPNLRADFLGISSHHRFAHFTRAILEGVAFSIRDCYSTIESLGELINKLWIMGGGAKSELWCQIISDVVGQTLHKPATGNAAIGSALIAGVATGVFKTYEEAIHPKEPDQEFTPDPYKNELYQTYYDVYRDVTLDLAKYSHKLTTLANMNQMELK